MLYHVSFFPVEQFYPRVPKARCSGENSDILRISFSNKSELDALRAVPDAAKIIQQMLDAGIKLFNRCWMPGLSQYYMYIPYQNISTYLLQIQTSQQKESACCHVSRQHFMFQMQSIPENAGCLMSRIWKTSFARHSRLQK